jgi:hypothetical protein
VGLRDGALHIDNDGPRGQFTQYLLRPPDSPASTVELTAEVQVVANRGRAATLSVPGVGRLRLFPDHIEMGHDPSLSVSVTPGVFHTYRVVSDNGRMELYVDGALALDTDRVDNRTQFSAGWHPDKSSLYALAFGNESEPVFEKGGFLVSHNVLAPDIPAAVTGYSLWRRVEAVLDDPRTGRRVTAWSAASGDFPDQYQLDHAIVIEASALGWDQGYADLAQLPDGRIFVVNYTDDTAPAAEAGFWTGLTGVPGLPWIRGTYVLPSDLPSAGAGNQGGYRA